MTFPIGAPTKLFGYVVAVCLLPHLRVWLPLLTVPSS